jgi:hypothetical protein
VLLLAGGGAALAVMAASPAPCSASAAAGRATSAPAASRDVPAPDASATDPPPPGGSLPRGSSPSQDAAPGAAPPHAGSPDASPPVASKAHHAPRHRVVPRGWAHARRPVTAPWVDGAAPVALPPAGPAPVVLHTPGNAASAGRRRLIHGDSVDEGFLLGLPSSGGPVTYLPPQPEHEGVDPASATLAGLAALLAVTGGGALLLALRLRCPAATRSARVSVALPPGARRRRPPGRRPARLSRETFDRLPPLLQLALLDRSRGSPPDVTDTAPRTAPAAPP